MSIDNSKIKFTPMNLDELDAQARQIGFGASNSQFFQFKDGRNVVRFLPGMGGRQPFIMFWKHFVKDSGAGKMYGGLCPNKMARLPCAVCAVAAKLSRGGDADRNVAQDISARSKIVAALIDRSSPDLGPQVVEFGARIFRALTDYMKAMGEDPTNPDDGFDMIVERQGSGLKTEYNVTAVRKNSPLHTDQRQADEWLESIPDLSTYVVLPSESEQVLRLANTVVGHMLSEAPAAPRAKQLPTKQPVRASAKAAMVDVDADEDDGAY